MSGAVRSSAPVESSALQRTPRSLARSNKKEPSRKLDSRLGARKADHTFFEWLTKRIEHHCAELSHFVEKQHATVRKRDLAGANSMFYGPQLLTTANPARDRDRHLMDRLGLVPMPA